MPKKQQQQRNARNRLVGRASGNSRNNNRPSAPVSYGTTTKASQYRSQREVGTAQLIALPSVQSTVGSMVYWMRFNLAGIPRLNRLKDNYLRYRPHKLHYRVVPSAPTTTAGNYVVKFFNDPLYREPEVLTESTPAQVIASSEGSQTLKWWECATVKVSGLGRDYYVQESGDLRLCSPGIFALANNNPPTSDVGLVIELDYDIEFSEAVLTQELAEDPEESLPAEYDVCCFWNAGDSALGYAVGYVRPPKWTSFIFQNIDAAFPFLRKYPDGTKWYFAPNDAPVLMGYTLSVGGKTVEPQESWVPQGVELTRVDLNHMPNLRVLKFFMPPDETTPESSLGVKSTTPYNNFPHVVPWKAGDPFDKYGAQLEPT